MPVSIKGTGGGSVTLSAAAAATDTTLTIPNVTGTVLQSGTAVTAAQGGTGLTSVGTSGNVLTSNGTAWVSSAPAAASLTLLATLTTTSGTTQSATGLATTYTNLLIIGQNVSPSPSSGNLNLAVSANNGSTYGTAVSISNYANLYFTMYIYLANSNVTTRSSSSNIGGAYSIATAASGAINAVQFSWSGGQSFSTGTIYIYGWN